MKLNLSEIRTDVKDSVDQLKSENLRNLATLHPMQQLEVLIMIQRDAPNYRDEYSLHNHAGLLIELMRK